MDYKAKFIEIFNENIKRDGAENLLNWILKSDFFTAPASTKFHSNEEGGLVKHSVMVYERFLKKLVSEYGENFEEKYSKETIAIVGLLHDVCKIDYYKVEYRNVKENGEWIQKPYYTVSDNLPYGHGEKSVYILSSFIKLTREEAMAINWHMGGFDARVQGGSYSLSDAFSRYPLAVLFHSADLETTYLDEIC